MRREASFRLVASQCLEDVAKNHRATCGGDAAALHQMRVAVTRLRAAISFFSPMVADSEWLQLRSELKWINRYLGATRDLDVAIETIEGDAGAQLFGTARIASQKRLKDALESDRYGQWFSAMRDWVESGPWSASQDPRTARRRASRAPEYHLRKLRRWHDKLVKRSRGLLGMGRNELHGLRIASKRLRYAIEFSAVALPKEDFAQWRDMTKHLRKGQQILGELNDAEMRKSLAADLAPAIKTARDLRQLKLPDRKTRARLLRRAAAVYREITR